MKLADTSVWACVCASPVYLTEYLFEFKVCDNHREELNMLMAHTLAAFCRNDSVLNRSPFGYFGLH